jgi:hypothetical protein
VKRVARCYAKVTVEAQVDVDIDDVEGGAQQIVNHIEDAFRVGAMIEANQRIDFADVKVSFVKVES